MKNFKPLAILGASVAFASFGFASATTAQTAGNSFTIAETGQSFSTLQAAVDAVGNRTATISIAPGTYRQCAVQKAGVITYTAQEFGTAIFSGTACEGKASLVLRGQGAEVRGLTFTGISVPDGNGAGIRLEKNNLNIAFTRFLSSQQGILTANDAQGRIFITRSTFSRLGTCENSAGCAHSIYVGKYGALTVTQSRFERGTGGHYVKSRAPNNVIENNSFDDAQGTSTNYMIDLPNGSLGTIANNMFVQGRDKENYSALIALGAKGTQNPSDGLVVRNNEARFVPGLSRKTAFLADWSNSRVVMEGNRLAAGIEQLDVR
ncbi:MAG: right-handed parallel beta-helix repeat-containing protein [Pseudomonadota bacterium]